MRYATKLSLALPEIDQQRYDRVQFLIVEVVLLISA
jgi:hypothetical protein